MPTLIEAVKELRTKKEARDNGTLVHHKVAWDLDTKFIGQPMTQHTMHALSSYIDQKLVEYARIHGYTPVVPDRQELIDEAGRALPDPDLVKKYHEFHKPIMESNAERTRNMIREIEHVATPDEYRGPEIYAELADEHIASEGEMESCGVVPAHSFNPTGLGVSSWHQYTAGVPSNTDVDDHVYSHGALPNVRHRVRDSFIRHRPPSWWETGKETIRFQKNFSPVEGIASYVTGYTIDYKSNRIDVSLLRAPGSVHVDDNEWFQYCTNGTYEGAHKEETIRDIIKANLCIIHKTSRSTPLPFNVPGPERTAMETLREMVTELEFRRYLLNGFIVARGTSGRFYQIFRDRSHIKVWYQGVLVEEICVGLGGACKVPPTDKVIALKNMLEVSEDLLRSSGNVYKMAKVA